MQSETLTMKDVENKQLVLRITGSVQQSNLKEFESAAMSVIAGIKTELKTDDDFAEAENNIKSCKLIEIRVGQARNDALQSTKEIADLVDAVERIERKFRDTRLTLERQVKTEKEKRKSEIITEAVRKIEADAFASPAKHGFSINFQAINEAMKGKKSIAKMREAVGAIVEVEKQRLVALECDYLANISAIEQSEAEFPGLFPDKKNLALSNPEVVAAQIESRVTSYKYKQKVKEDAARELAERKAKEEEERKAREAAVDHSVGGPYNGPPIIIEKDERETEVPQDSAWQPPLPPNPFIDTPIPPPPTAPCVITILAVSDNIEALINQIKQLPGVISAELQ